LTELDFFIYIFFIYRSLEKRFKVPVKLRRVGIYGN